MAGIFSVKATSMVSYEVDLAGQMKWSTVPFGDEWMLLGKMKRFWPMCFPSLSFGKSEAINHTAISNPFWKVSFCDWKSIATGFTGWYPSTPPSSKETTSSWILSTPQAMSSKVPSPTRQWHMFQCFQHMYVTLFHQSSLEHIKYTYFLVTLDEILT